MVRVWLISAHLFILFGAPIAVSAQAGSALAAPGERTNVPTLGRGLGDPIATPIAVSEPGGGAHLSLMPEGWTLDVSTLTSLPLSVGLDVQVQSPIGVFANLSVGHTPGAYLDMVATLLSDNGVFGDEVRPLVSEAMGDGGWNFRFGLGINPIEGLELSVGYTYLGASSGLSPAAIEAATGQRIRRSTSDVPLSIEMHALFGRVGYRFVIEERLVVRAALGWTHAVAASVHVDVPEAVRERPNNPATQIEQAVAEGFDQYGFTPEVQLSVGYRF